MSVCVWGGGCKMYVSGRSADRATKELTDHMIITVITMVIKKLLMRASVRAISYEPKALANTHTQKTKTTALNIRRQMTQPTEHTVMER